MAAASYGDRVKALLAALTELATARDRDNLVRFNIAAPTALGVSMTNIQRVARQAGRDHGLAQCLWDTGVYEARLMTSFVDEPSEVTSAQMDRWCREFDNWAVCDTLCFNLFDRTPHAWSKVSAWAGKRNEYVRRAAFALLWGLTVHDKAAPDSRFLEGLVLVERAAADERHFVKKAINMALRATGKRNASLNRAAVATAKRLAASPDDSARWIGADALRELTGPSVTRRLKGSPRA